MPAGLNNPENFRFGFNPDCWCCCFASPLSVHYVRSPAKFLLFFGRFFFWAPSFSFNTGYIWCIVTTLWNNALHNVYSYYIRPLIHSGEKKNYTFSSFSRSFVSKKKKTKILLTSFCDGSWLTCLQWTTTNIKPEDERRFFKIKMPTVIPILYKTTYYLYNINAHNSTKSGVVNITRNDLSHEDNFVYIWFNSVRAKPMKWCSSSSSTCCYCYYSYIIHVLIKKKTQMYGLPSSLRSVRSLLFFISLGNAEQLLGVYDGMLLHREKSFAEGRINTTTTTRGKQKSVSVYTI